jgi:hypothetical protein
MPIIPKLKESKTIPEGSGVSAPLTGVLKVSEKAGSFTLLALSPMQY